MQSPTKRGTEWNAAARSQRTTRSNRGGGRFAGGANSSRVGRLARQRLTAVIAGAKLRAGARGNRAGQMTSHQTAPASLNKAAHINQDNNQVTPSPCSAPTWMPESFCARGPLALCLLTRCLFISCTLSLLPCATQYGSGVACLRLPFRRGSREAASKDARCNRCGPRY